MISPRKETIAKWTAALRSGKYKQTTGHLQDIKGMCCLGVGCNIFIPEKKKIKDAGGMLEGSMPVTQVGAPQWLKDISLDFQHRFEKSFEADYDNTEYEGMELFEFNDTAGFSFDEIADLLELVYIHKALN